MSANTILRRLLVLATLCAGVGVAQAADTVIVLSAAGTMATQAQGDSKMSIARNVIDSLLPSYDATSRVGLTIFGSKSKSCTDVRTAVPLGAVNAKTTDAALDKTAPLGKSPVSAGLASAFAQLAKNGGRILLLTDGLDTCQKAPEPCDVVKTLAQKSPNVSIDVIGLGVSAADTVELACLAQTTNGRFVGIDTSKGIARAVALLQGPPPPAPIPVRSVDLEATIGTTNAADAVFSIYSGTDGGAMMTAGPGPVQLPLGIYRVTANSGTLGGLASLSLTASGPRTVTIALSGATPKAKVGVDKPSVAAGEAINVTWSGPANSADYLAIERADGTALPTNAPVPLAKANARTALRAPATPGAYQVVYRLGSDDTDLASAPFKVTASAAALNANPSAPAGSSIGVAWIGPGDPSDWIGFYKPGVGDDSYDQITAGAAGKSPMALYVPLEPGNYELRYIDGTEHVALARKSITVTPVSAALTAPPTIPATYPVSVRWRGPNGAKDFIAIAPLGSPAATISDGSWAYVADGPPVTVRAPAQSGTYELRYVQVTGNVRQVLATSQLVATTPTAAITAPANAPPGAQISVTFDGPDAKGDYIAISHPGLPANDTSLGWVAVSQDGSNAVTLTLPTTPGTYELRYVANVGPIVLARATIDVK